MNARCRQTRRPGAPSERRILAAVLFVAMAVVVVVTALAANTMSRAHADTSTPNSTLDVEMDTTSAVLVAGGWVDFNTTIRNIGSATTPPLVAHLSITATDRERHVDPEDWSPARTQFLGPISAGEAVRVDWRVHALFEGQFAPFVTVVSPVEGFVPAAGRPLLLNVTANTILPRGQVVPVVIAVPLLPLMLLAIVAVRRRRSWEAVEDRRLGRQNALDGAMRRPRSRT